MKHLRYTCRHGTLNKHPELVMKRLGIIYQYATPQSMGDQWWFWNCENIPTQLPEYLSELNDVKTNKQLNPMDQIGWGLSKEEAEKIIDYTKK